MTLCGAQREAVRAAALEGVAVITGGPGTGKTTSINCLIRLLERLGSVELCAPTGRAARRMSDATGRPARTIHRLLEYGGEGQGFARDADNPLDAGAVIVDEMSMVDLTLMRSLLRALRPGTRLVLVGDARPAAIGRRGQRAARPHRCRRGARNVPDRDLPQAEKSMIVVNAHRINRGEYPEFRVRGSDFFIERRDGAQEAARSVVELVRRRLPNYLGVDSLRGIQVMAPMKRGELGVFALNDALRAALNPSAPDAPSSSAANACSASATRSCRCATTMTSSGSMTVAAVPACSTAISAISRASTAPKRS